MAQDVFGFGTELDELAIDSLAIGCSTCLVLHDQLEAGHHLQACGRDAAQRIRSPR
jgi:hypothetical protein